MTKQTNTERIQSLEERFDELEEYMESHGETLMRHEVSLADFQKIGMSVAQLQLKVDTFYDLVRNLTPNDKQESFLHLLFSLSNWVDSLKNDDNIPETVREGLQEWVNRLIEIQKSYLEKNAH